MYNYKYYSIEVSIDSCEYSTFIQLLANRIVIRGYDECGYMYAKFVLTYFHQNLYYFILEDEMIDLDKKYDLVETTSTELYRSFYIKLIDL